jgi:ribosomal protein S3
MQSFIQVKQEPFVNRSELVGLRFSISGRPQKSSRTRYYSFQFGQIKRSDFYRYNVTKTFAAAKAKIGSFGISFLSAT